MGFLDHRRKPIHQVKETLMSSASEILTCSACLCPEPEWKGSTKGPCGHSMCMPCFMMWVRLGKPSCPLCRTEFLGQDQGQDQDQNQYQYEDQYPDEDEINSLETRRRNHWAEVTASRARRTDYLYSQQAEFRAHCITCTDQECRKTHDRRMRWLCKGKLTPCPEKLSSLPKCTLGLLLPSKQNCSATKRIQLTLQSEAAGEHVSWRRQIGLQAAINYQKAQKADRQQTILMHRGDVKGRLGTTLAMATTQLSTIDLATYSGPNKVFRGFCPPKRGARTGDYYTNGTEKAICTGYNRWTFANGTVARLIGKTWDRD